MTAYIYGARLSIEPRADGTLRPKGTTLLGWSLAFFVMALVAGLLGFSGLAGAATLVAKIVAVIAIAIFANLLALVLTAPDAIDKTMRGWR